jgi:RND family efflux transporter MFP subunit
VDVSDLKKELASLRIDRHAPASGARRWPWLLLVLLLAAAGAVYAYMARAGATTEVETARAAVSAPGTGAPGTPILTASGYVVARRKAVVSAKIQGRLAELRVEEGSAVREGEVLARLESADYEAAVQVAQAQAQRAEADLAESQRQERLATQLTADKVVAQDTLDAAASRVRVAQAALAQARAGLAQAQAFYENTIIRAPFSGVVVKKMAEVGESVAPIPPGVNISTSSGAIVALADLATLEVEVDVAESNVARLGADQPAEVTVEAFPDRRYQGVLRQVIPTADRTKATVMVKVTILDKDKDLKPEMSAKANFLEAAGASAAPERADAPPLVTVPKEALVTRDGRSLVFEVQDGRVRGREVRAGGERQGQVVIQQGLSGDETLVVRPPDTLRDGDAIKVKGS